MSSVQNEEYRKKFLLLLLNILRDVAVATATATATAVVFVFVFVFVFLFFFVCLADGRTGRGEQTGGSAGVRQVPLHQGDVYR